MCRFAFYLGKPVRLSSLVVEPKNSLIHQSFHSHEREEPLNGDGFGVAWYVPAISERPAAFRSITPAWSNRNLLELARVLESPCILAHVRAATQQLQVAEVNCHPFTRGPYAFMHNGDIGGFKHIRRPLIDILSEEAFLGISGSTDSEHLFALFLDLLPKQTGGDSLESMVKALRAAISRIIELGRKYAPGAHSYLNLVVTDGTSAVACRFTTDAPKNADSLYMNHGRRYICEEGVCRMLEPEHGETAILVSSEQLSDDPGWSEVPVNHLIRIHASRQVVIEPLADVA